MLSTLGFTRMLRQQSWQRSTSLLVPSCSRLQYKLAKNPRSITMSSAGDVQVMISKHRLDELLRAEVAYLQTVPVQPFSVQEVLKNRDTPYLVNFIQKETPKRLAMRLRMIEGLAGWEQVPQMVELHEMLIEWYELLALAPGERDLNDFTTRVNRIRTEGKLVVSMAATGIRKFRLCEGGNHDDEFLDGWMDSFLLSRISSNMIFDQYRATVAREHGGRICRPTGIIDQNCNATHVCATAARTAQQLCKMHLGKDPQFVIQNFVAGRSGPQPSGSCTFSFIPGFLRYIVTELTKNSFDAIIKNRVNDEDKISPVRIIVCCDAQRVAIRVSDRGGGIPFDIGDKIWSYLYGAAAAADSEDHVHNPTALAGYGVGLPLSRLHARYLGGKLYITTYPGLGTDAHLVLPRIEADQVEQMPLGNW